MIFAREFRLSTGTKLGALVLGTVLLVVLGVFLAFGFVLLLGLAAAGLVLGTGAALYRRLSGRPSVERSAAAYRRGLDPTLEIEPPPPGVSPPDRYPAARSVDGG